MTFKITSEVFMVGGENTHPHDAAVYLISSGGTCALVDAGTGKCSSRILDNIKKAGADPSAVKYIFLTHCHYDHTGGAEELRELTGAQTIAHELDAVFLSEGNSTVTAASWYGETQPETTVDITISGKNGKFTVGDLEITAIHAPGHTPGSIVLLLSSDGKKVLFGQDVHGPLHPDLKSDRADYISSLKMLAALDADLLCEGHYGVISGRGKVRDFIKSFIN